MTVIKLFCYCCFILKPSVCVGLPTAGRNVYTFRVSSAAGVSVRIYTRRDRQTDRQTNAGPTFYCFPLDAVSIYRPNIYRYKGIIRKCLCV